MSSLVHGDPEAIRAFAQRLNKFCDELREALSGVSAHLSELGTSSWTDSKYQEYLAMFEPVVANLHRTVEEMQPEHVGHLYRKAQELEDYINGS